MIKSGNWKILANIWIADLLGKIRIRNSLKIRIWVSKMTREIICLKVWINLRKIIIILNIVIMGLVLLLLGNKIMNLIIVNKISLI